MVNFWFQSVFECNIYSAYNYTNLLYYFIIINIILYWQQIVQKLNYLVTAQVVFPHQYKNCDTL